MRKIIICLVTPILMTLSALHAGAQSGSEALPYTRIDFNPVTAAMGGADAVSTGSIAYASFSNSAAIPFSDRKLDVTAAYLGWQPSASHVNGISAAGAFNTGKFGFSAGLYYGIAQKYGIVDENGLQSGSFTPSDMQVNVGAAWKFVPFLSLGVNLKYLRSSLAQEHSYGAFASDIFLMTKIAGFKVAAGISSLGTKVSSASGEKFSLPASVTVGAGYGNVFGQKHGLDILVDADCYLGGAFCAAAGAGYTYNDLVSIRAGYRYGGKSVIPSYASVGAGVKFFGVHIDAAYLIATGDSPLKNTFSVGVGYSF